MLIAVILGNRMNDDGTLSQLMQTRLQLALRLKDCFNPQKIILSCGIANKKAGKAEADGMFDYLVGKNVSADLLVKEDKSHTTKENALFSVRIAKELGADELIICSTNEHLSRSYLNPIKLFEQQLKGSGIKLTVLGGE